jgi:hypothetical protein
VVVGSTATGNNLSDLGPTPLARESHLMSMHVNTANALLCGRFVRRSSVGAELALILAFGLFSC